MDVERADAATYSRGLTGHQFTASLDEMIEPCPSSNIKPEIMTADVISKGRLIIVWVTRIRRIASISAGGVRVPRITCNNMAGTTNKATSMTSIALGFVKNETEGFLLEDLK